jgi:fructokinase
MATDGGTTSPEPVVAVIGEALIDLAEDGDDEPRLARPGGSPYNVAIGLARLERHAAFVGRFSADPLGAVLRRHAERSSVDLSLSIAAPEPSSIAMVELVDGIARYRFGVEGTADFQFIDAELAPVADTVHALHFGSLASWTAPGDAAIERLVRSVRGRLLVTYDPNVRPHLQPDPAVAREQVERSLALAHLVKTSDEDVAYLYPGVALDEVARGWLALGPAVVIVTRGGEGATAFTAGSQVDRPVGRTAVVDTVGAGDSFMSGLLDGLIERDLLTPGALDAIDAGVLGELLERASLIAAITCSRAGANPPRRSELSID